MQLWQNIEVVDALKRILEKYKYLEYDEQYSRYWAERSDQDKLKIKITDRKKVPKNACIAQWIRDELRIEALIFVSLIQLGDILMYLTNRFRTDVEKVRAEGIEQGIAAAYQQW